MISTAIDKSVTPMPLQNEMGTAGLLKALREQLSHLQQLIAHLSAHDYSQLPAACTGGTIGGHVRHSLDHIAALLKDGPGGQINYDRRQRGTRIEYDPSEASLEIDRLIELLAHMSGALMDCEVSVAALYSVDDAPGVWRSTLGRELLFVFNHTVHHAAMIATIMRSMGLTVLEHMGVAPSTMAHRKHGLCAP